MAEDLLALADRLWMGEDPAEERHPWTPVNQVAEVADGVGFVSSFANVSAFATRDGLVLVDTGSFMLASQVHELVRGWTDLPLSHAIWTHGHVDHVFGVDLYEAERSEPAPTVVAHEGVPVRHDRYVRSAGWNGAINERQFQAPGLTWPREYRRPDVTYRDSLTLQVGGEVFELHHARGETDDHTWVWVPGRRVLCCGDLFTWTLPNAGNPQKVQRYARDWAAALREMASLGAEVMLPGHGPPVVGAERIVTALGDTAGALEGLHDGVLALMNEGADLDRVIHEVQVPPELRDKPYLRPVYDEPEFVARNVWRLYGGWWDGNPAHLKPAPYAALAGELAACAGGAERLADRARELAAAGELRLAGHLAELAAASGGASRAVRETRAEVLERRAENEVSTMARGVFASAAREAREQLERDDPSA
jgi:alkyl sulfatase BDS1-like metallo-beta-lactamase superfamily hydrolase